MFVAQIFPIPLAIRNPARPSRLDRSLLSVRRNFAASKLSQQEIKWDRPFFQAFMYKKRLAMDTSNGDNDGKMKQETDLSGIFTINFISNWKTLKSHWNPNKQISQFLSLYPDSVKCTEEEDPLAKGDEPAPAENGGEYQKNWKLNQKIISVAHEQTLQREAREKERKLRRRLES